MTTTGPGGEAGTASETGTGAGTGAETATGAGTETETETRAATAQSPLARANAIFGPVFALGSGIATVVYFPRGASFAPVAAAVVVFGWIGAAVAARWLGERPGEARGRRWARFVAGTVITGMIQNALFFATPLWFGSATLDSVNLVFPIVLAVMTLFSCFELPFRRLVLADDVAWPVWCAVVLFATLVAVLPGLGPIPLRASFAVAAAIGGGAAALAIGPAKGRLRRAALALPLAAVAALVAPLLPPVPLRTVSKATGVEVVEKQIVEPQTEFPAGTPVVNAWFAVNAPRRYRQALEFHWHKDGRAVGAPYRAELVGGRERGFRVWAAARAPGPGEWRVDLRTASGQLIGRQRFRVR